MSHTVNISGIQLPFETLRHILAGQGFTILTKEQVGLASVRGYIARYYELTVDSRTYEEAWRQVEEEHFAVFGFHRYTSRDSFRTSTPMRARKRKLTPKPTAQIAIPFEQSPSH